MHSERSGDGHSPPGAEACSPGNFLCSEIKSGAFGSTNSAYSTFDMLGTQQYWITGIAGNNRVAFVAK